jgi:hypothetical protein
LAHLFETQKDVAAWIDIMSTTRVFCRFYLVFRAERELFLSRPAMAPTWWRKALGNGHPAKDCRQTWNLPKLRSIFFFSLYTTTVKTSTTKAHPVGVNMVSPSTCAIPPTTVQKARLDDAAISLVPDHVQPLLFRLFVVAAAMSCYLPLRADYYSESIVKNIVSDVDLCRH